MRASRASSSAKYAGIRLTAPRAPKVGEQATTEGRGRRKRRLKPSLIAPHLSSEGQKEEADSVNGAAMRRRRRTVASAAPREGRGAWGANRHGVPLAGRRGADGRGTWSTAASTERIKMVALALAQDAGPVPGSRRQTRPPIAVDADCGANQATVARCWRRPEFARSHADAAGAADRSQGIGHLEWRSSFITGVIEDYLAPHHFRCRWRRRLHCRWRYSTSCSPSAP